jgi:hypothetical protein
LPRIFDGEDYVANLSVNGIELKAMGRSDSIARPSDLPPLPGPATAASKIPLMPPVFNPGTPKPDQKSAHAQASVVSGDALSIFSLKMPRQFRVLRKSAENSAHEFGLGRRIVVTCYVICVLRIDAPYITRETNWVG